MSVGTEVRTPPSSAQQSNMTETAQKESLYVNFKSVMLCVPSAAAATLKTAAADVALRVVHARSSTRALPPPRYPPSLPLLHIPPGGGLAAFPLVPVRIHAGRCIVFFRGRFGVSHVLATSQLVDGLVSQTHKALAPFRTCEVL